MVLVNIWRIVGDTEEGDPKRAFGGIVEINGYMYTRYVMSRSGKNFRVASCKFRQAR